MSDAPPSHIAETAFEKRRGINSVESRPGFAQVHISKLGQPLMERRLQVLGAVADGGISIDFLKLTQTGLSFVVPEESAGSVSGALSALDVHGNESAGSLISEHVHIVRELAEVDRRAGQERQQPLIGRPRELGTGGRAVIDIGNKSDDLAAIAGTG